LGHGLLVLSVPSVPTHRRILGDAVRTHRKRVKMTQEKLAEKTGLSVVFLSLLENGHRTVSVDALLRIAKALGIRIRDLVDEL
jgi:transcriptional regulator with XRE-family HTH domain